MELPATAQGAGAPAAPVLSTSHQDAADFQRLYDALEAPPGGAPADPAAADPGAGAEDDPNERPDLGNAALEGAEGEDPAAGAAGAAKVPGTEGAGDGKEAKPGEGESQTLEEFLKENGPEPFLNLRFKTKVDGQEAEVPLAELLKERQLAAASYARMSEAAQARQQFDTERAQVRQALGVQIKQAQQLLHLARGQLTQDFQGIDWATLRTQDPANAALLQSDFQARNAAIEQQLQQVAAAERANAQAADTQRQQAIAVERERLFAARPEWRDATKGQAAHQAIRAVGRQLGFTDAELNGITDHRMLIGLDLLARHLTQARERQAQIPKVLKRVRAAPKMAAPGTRSAAPAKAGANKQLDEAWLASGGRNDQLGAEVFSRFVS